VVVPSSSEDIYQKRGEEVLSFYFSTDCEQMNSHVEPSVTQIIKSINKFDGTNFLEWKRQTRAVISLSLPSISEIINGKTRPTVVLRNVRGRSTARTRPPRTRSQGRDIFPHEEEDDGVEESSVASVVANEDERLLYDRANEQLFNILYLTTTGPANSYMLRFEPQGSDLPDGKKAWDGLIAKYQNSSKQRRRILMRQLDNLTMSQGEDPDLFLSKIYQIKDELTAIGEIITEER